ncbi:MAG: endonuclease domain-containing protein [Chloroflexota bacterium]
MNNKKHLPRVSKDLWAKLKPLAQEKRQNPTPAEQHLWSMIRNRQIANLKFRRQYIIENFIVDFYCAELKLIIEVDGEIHKYQRAHDKVRQQQLETHGTTVLRFTNEQVLEETDYVISIIEEQANKLREESSPSL